MQLHGAASQNKYTVLWPLRPVKQNRARPGCWALTSNFRTPIAIQALFHSRWVGFFIVGYLFLPWVQPVGLFLHTELCVLAYYHTKTRECLSSLLEMGSICLRTEKVMKHMPSSCFHLPFAILSRCAVCDTQFGLVLK